MKVYLLMSSFCLANASCSLAFGLWVAGVGDEFPKVRDALGLDGLTEIQELNPWIELKLVHAGARYKIPYRTAIPPASWSDDCPAFLTLDDKDIVPSTEPMNSISVTNTF
ncbi:hypothetical protein BKA56DRAFT_623657 [Ilyonectria sp. MPI-CAGE-AT-0026]|nr:hypothetical protein BKA56DRAFT_626338 [Ilyonectria sp. MPI-CAGE-AT-0026]KAH6961684.1 hypothetical protein BKA56DRAFT_623657 [Ilyonectria sp. MPI-CAGE-AT-0026]